MWASVIINNCIQSGTWPDFLKHEMVTPIPKVPQPKVIDDLRNISGLMNVNKVILNAEIHGTWLEDKQ